MPQLAPYIPPKDADLDLWATNFSTLITASPGTYGLVAADATAIAAVYSTWHTAYLLVTSPSTRTPTTVAAKDTAKILLLDTLRPYSVVISLNAGVTSGNKVALGVNPRTSTPVPIAEPTTVPVITVQPIASLVHAVRFRDEMASPSVKSKPYGAIALQLMAKASATVITDPTQLLFVASATKSPFSVNWGSGDTGKQAYYAARWMTRRGLFGPWSSVESMTVAS